MELYIGIDPSINSTGITVLGYEDDAEIFKKFYIIKPGKLTKREKNAELLYISFFEYILYDKHEKNEISAENEIGKTLDFIFVCNNIKDIIYKELEKNTITKIVVCEEGISYGSSNTKSVFDLSGLNYLIRYTILSIIKSLNFGKLFISTPAQIKKFATGKGNANKQMIIDKFKEIHQSFDIPKIDDISDSYFMAKYAKENG